MIGGRYIHIPEYGADVLAKDGRDALKMKRIIPVIVALLLIVIIGGIYFGGKLWDKYSYGKELADMDEYFGVTDDDKLAIILQDEMLEGRQAVVKDGAVYFDLDMVHEYFNEGFYADTAEQKLLYTTAVDTVTALFGEKSYSDENGGGQTEYTICYMDGDTLYVAADYVKLFTNYEYRRFDRHLQVYTEWGVKETMTVAKDTQIRTLGGIKSPILRQVEKGEVVELLDQMEKWSKVKTSDSLIGYIENKRLSDLDTETETPVTDYNAPEYTGMAMENKVSLGWHSIGGPNGGSSTLDAMIAEVKASDGKLGINVIAPTWFSLSDNSGGFQSFAEASYVERAHGYGLQVWGVWDNFNYANNTGTAVSSYEVLSSTTVRQQLVRNIVDTSLGLGLDGVNIDFEGLTEDCGRHYVQFLRELSVLCRKNGLVLSVDNYVPFHFNNFYRLDIQGQIADYVIIMGYDEHWHGSQDPGSVASIDYVSNGLSRTLEQVPAQKVVNALPFYTILWRTEGDTVTDEFVTIANEASFLQQTGAQPEWDEETCQNYAQWQEGSATYQIWLEDEESLNVKLNVMAAQNIGGVAVWRIGYGTEASWKLVRSFAGL